jgi:Flp pilus assembly protein TadB
MPTDIGLIVALLACTATIVGVIIAMMFWMRSEANALRAEAKEDRKDLLQISRNLENAIQNIQNEMKDFHRELLAIQKKVV